MIDVDPAIKKMRWDAVFSMPRDELAAVVKAHQSINHQVNDAWHFYMKKSNLHSPDRHTHHSLTVFITQYADVILERYGPEFAIPVKQPHPGSERDPDDGEAKEETFMETRKRTCPAASNAASKTKGASPRRTTSDSPVSPETQRSISRSRSNSRRASRWTRRKTQTTEERHADACAIIKGVETDLTLFQAKCIKQAGEMRERLSVARALLDPK